MVKRAKRARGQKRIMTPTPSGRTSVRFRGSRPGAPRCSICGSIMRGIPYSSIRKHPKSGRRPSRPYGGTICHACLMEAFRRESRGQS